VRPRANPGAREASFERINYSIRPAKSTERRMMVEAFGHLAAIAPLTEYQYIGFGSTFFIDFKLLHRQLGIRSMISIEKEIEKRERFLFNRPFSCVKMHFGTAGEYLSTNWRRSRRSIIWLDYDYRLDNDVLADIDRVIERAASGTFLAITVDADLGRSRDIWPDIDRELGLDRLPGWVDGKRRSLMGWGLARAYLEIADSSLRATLQRARPGWRWHQVLHFRYADGARMLTLGGVLVSPDPGESARFEACRFDQLPFYRPGADAFEIRVPNLTGAEIATLSRRLPGLTARDRGRLRKLAISDQDVDDYQALYRYVPQFVESQA